MNGEWPWLEISSWAMRFQRGKKGDWTERYELYSSGVNQGVTLIPCGCFLCFSLSGIGVYRWIPAREVQSVVGRSWDYERVRTSFKV